MLKEVCIREADILEKQWLKAKESKNSSSPDEQGKEQGVPQFVIFVYMFICVYAFLGFFKWLKVTIEAALKSVEVNFDYDIRPYAYLLSLLATSVEGFPEKEHFLYDVATELELKGFRVKFLSAKDIKEFYKKHHPGYDEEEVNIYEMTKFFISMHKGSSFFLDEVPFTKASKYGTL